MNHLRKILNGVVFQLYTFVNRSLGLLGIELKRKHKNQYKRLQKMDIDTVIDIGANIGQFLSEYHRILPQARFHSFEPLPTTFTKLKKNHGDKTNVNVYNVGLGHTQSIIEMNECDYDPSSSMLEMTDIHKTAYPHTQGLKKTQVKVETLDSFNIRGKNMLVKIDTQGYEDQIIAGGKETIKSAKICILETSFYPLYVGQPLFKNIYDTMLDLGFIYYGALEQGIDPKDGKCLFQDSVFIKKD